MQKAHAKHNESVCNFLMLSEHDFNDWVVTTAFYSALHYVQNEIFPIKIGETTFNSFDEYYASLHNPQSKHITTLNLVSNYLNKASEPYRFLLDSCKNARYKNYIISDPMANGAIGKLKTVKSQCKK